MILCLDVGNSQIYGGLYSEKAQKFVLNFRQNSRSGASSDEYGLFLRGVLRENGFSQSDVQHISLCTVVPEVLHSIRNCCLKYFQMQPFVLQAGVKTGMKVKVRNPLEVGADRIADAIGAASLYPNENVAILDFGTATTVSVVNQDKEFLGGAIMPGVRISMEALEQRTSRLPSVEIVVAPSALGRSTVESIQSGLFFGTMGAVKEILKQISNEELGGQRPRVIGTGGIAGLFQRTEIYDVEVPDLVLRGLYHAFKLNDPSDKE